MFEFDVDLSYMPAGAAAAASGDGLCWHPVNSRVPRERMAAEFGYVGWLLARARNRVDVRDLHVSGVTGEPCPARKDILLHRNLLRLLHELGMEFSYGAFCSVYRDSHYTVDRFNVLTVSSPELWAALEEVRVRDLTGWKTLAGEYGGRPYMVLDSQDNSAPALLHHLAKLTEKPWEGIVRLDYFTNCSCTFWNLDTSDFADLARLGVHLEVSLHPAMKTAPEEGDVDPGLFRHAIRLARKELANNSP